MYIRATSARYMYVCVCMYVKVCVEINTGWLMYTEVSQCRVDERENVALNNLRLLAVVFRASVRQRGGGGGGGGGGGVGGGEREGHGE